MKLVIEDKHIVAIRDDGQRLEFDLDYNGLATTAQKLQLVIAPDGEISLTVPFQPPPDAPG